MCAVFLAVIEGVGIGFQRMMADNTKLEVPRIEPSGFGNKTCLLTINQPIAPSSSPI